MNLADIDTPAVLVDEKKARANITRFQTYADEHGFALRPHIKTHKLPLFARAQVEAGAAGINCQKIGEAEVMADAGLSDILITYNIIGAQKLERLVALGRRLERLVVTADNEAVVTGLSAAFASEAKPLNVLVECDTGGGRQGVQNPEAAVALGATIASSPGLEFVGLMTYPKPGGGPKVQAFMSAAKAALEEKGIACPVISSGGTPDMWKAHEVPVVTEYRAGTYIYYDRSVVAAGAGTYDDCALTVLATVVSTPTPDRAIIDAGSKVLTSDLLGLTGHGHVLGRDDLVIAGLNEEHGIVRVEGGEPTGLTVGDRLRIVPNHCCVVSNMVDAVVLVDGESWREVPVAARGKVR